MANRKILTALANVEAIRATGRMPPHEKARDVFTGRMALTDALFTTNGTGAKQSVGASGHEVVDTKAMRAAVGDYNSAQAARAASLEKELPTHDCSKSPSLLSSAIGLIGLGVELIIEQVTAKHALPSTARAIVDDLFTSRIEDHEHPKF